MNEDDQDLGRPHPDTDPAHARLRAVLRETGAGIAPPAGWEAAVWRRIDSASVQIAGRHHRWIWPLAGVAAAAIALWIWRPWVTERDAPAPAEADLGSARTEQRMALAPRLELRRGREVMRGQQAAPGDTLVVTLDTPGAAVWIYRATGALVAACDAVRTAPPTCRATAAGGAILELTLGASERIDVITAVTAADAAPPTLDEALATLTRAGARFRRDEFDVR